MNLRVHGAFSSCLWLVGGAERCPLCAAQRGGLGHRRRAVQRCLWRHVAQLQLHDSVQPGLHKPAGLRSSHQLLESVSCLVLYPVCYASLTGLPFISTILDGMRGL